ncbi:transforming acidic coiled-coil-containing protein 1-like isoform X3 [Centruroides vittatus]
MVGNMAKKQTIGSGKLIDFSPSPKKKDSCNPANQQLDNGSSHPLQETKMFSEDEVNQALKMQELLYQEKLIKKDKEWNEKQKLYDKEKQQLKNQNIALKQALAVASFVALEMSKMFSLFKDQKEQERVEMTATNQRLIKERDQALEDLQNVESAFADLHRRYEKAKGVLEGYKQNEDKLRDQCSELQDKIKQQEQKFDLLRLRTEEKLESANTELESAKKGVEAEVTVLRAQVKKAEMKISSLERNLEQKNKENTELSNICDELIAKVGKT